MPSERPREVRGSRVPRIDSTRHHSVTSPSARRSGHLPGPCPENSPFDDVLPKIRLSAKTRASIVASRLVHWYEGMFLRPQHFQAADRCAGEALKDSEEWHRPFNWGLRSVEFDRDA